MEHFVTLSGQIITAVIGPVLVAWLSRRWSAQDRELADEVMSQLKSELASAQSALAAERAKSAGSSDGSAPSSPDPAAADAPGETG